MNSAKTDGLRRQVLDAAVAIAATSGPDVISMREVARLAGVSHQAPYHHFGDRAGIFAAISEEGSVYWQRQSKPAQHVALQQCARPTFTSLSLIKDISE